MLKFAANHDISAHRPSQRPYVLSMGREFTVQ
jgi:hypothetical protein